MQHIILNTDAEIIITRKDVILFNRDLRAKQRETIVIVRAVDLYWVIRSARFVA